MQKKLLIGLVALVIIAGGAYAIFHKSPTTPASSTTGGSSSSTSSGPIVQTKTASNVGQYLADSNGNALYTYGADTSGVSNCSGTCTYDWPIYSADTSATLPANVTIVTRSDGTKQYAYKGMPLYTFSSDSSGQVTGDSVSNFHVAKP